MATAVGPGTICGGPTVVFTLAEKEATDDFDDADGRFEPYGRYDRLLPGRRSVPDPSCDDEVSIHHDDFPSDVRSRSTRIMW